MDAIAAISTAPGNGGIGIIRISGKDTYEVLKKIFKMKNNEDIDKIPGYTMKYGHIVESDTGEVIDEVLVSFFKEPCSFTRENMCEINSHGGIIVEKRILEECLKNGAELAEPGEFTKRAFLNGRIDLSQAESIIELINAKTEKEAKASINQLEGRLSEKINSIKMYLLDIMADVEASIDYPEYDIEEMTSNKADTLLNKAKNELVALENTFKSGKILKDGVNTAIIGRPNAGKSSLLNCMLKEERAIVSEIEGTTRDTIEEFVNIRGIPLKIIDTAGIRKTDDIVEEIGVKKALKVADDAELVIAIFDNSKDLVDEDFEILNLIKDKNAIIIFNKVDLNDAHNENIEEIKSLNKDIIKISTRNQDGIDKLYDKIEDMFKLNEIDLSNDVIITEIRHKNQIRQAVENIDKAIETVKLDMPIDVVAVYIKETLECLGHITGENISEDIINEIFSKFCLGK